MEIQNPVIFFVEIYIYHKERRPIAQYGFMHNRIEFRRGHDCTAQEKGSKRRSN